jgi:hypothetical protein
MSRFLPVMSRLLPILCTVALFAISTPAQTAPERTIQAAPAQTVAQSAPATTAAEPSAQAAPAQSDSEPSPQSAPATPRISAVLDGPRTVVFTAPDDSCIPADIPDAMARAFRDSTGTVHFMTASSELFQSLGPTLDTVQHSCAQAFYSDADPNPGHFNDQAWLDSFYTLDGVNVVALSHTEYHGWSHPGECHQQDPNNFFFCEDDSDTYHLSKDGGFHYESFGAPHNFVAGVPFKYQLDNGPTGYSVDSNIISYGGWYYAIATDWQWPRNCSGKTGPHPCQVPGGGAPIRTQNIFDPSSWRGWNGADFSVAFVDPYLGPVANPEQHVYTPVPNMQFVNGLNVYQTANVAVAVLWDYFDDELGSPGLYFTTSTDMVNWTKPKLVVTLAQIRANDPEGSFLYAYFSLIDPNAPDLSFSVIGDHPYLYYVRLDNNNVFNRVVYRQALTLTPIQ